MVVIHMKIIKVFFLTLLISTLLWAGQKNKSWINPHIGFTGDMILDISDVESEWSQWTTEGFNIRSGELILGADIDPYARLTTNINFTLGGVELHELYSCFPYLPGNLSLNVGWKLAKFGRWNQFHTHAMPFTAEPRLYIEYFGGHFSGIGTELSWLAPTPFYLEATVSIYDDMHGHTHDSDPSKYPSPLEQRAAELGYEKHGSHWHDSAGNIIEESDLQDPLEPSRSRQNQSFRSFPLVGRIKTSFDFGSDWSADLGGSAVYQAEHLYSNRIDDHTYSKAVIGADLTFFWHPLSMNRYRHVDFGAEWLLNYEENEKILTDSTVIAQSTWRQGIFGHVHYKHNARWHFGMYGELFEAQEQSTWIKKRWGIFTTMEISHFQFLRLEGSVYHQSPSLPPVHRLTLQYDVSIGYHSHGTQR